MNPVYPDEKGVSEIIGALLLIIILVTAFAVLGAIFISQPVYEKIPAVHIQISNESKTIHIYHDGGDPIPLDKMYILVDGARLPFTIDNNADTWRIGRTLTTVSSDMPNRVDIVYQGLTAGSGIILSTLLLGVQTSQSGPTYYFTIVSSANSGGSISPAGSVLVASGSSQTFSITPNAGYILSDVNVDGSSLGAIPSYTFPGVNADHTISALFVPSVSNLFTINATAGPGGIISPGNMTVLFGANLTYVITPNPGYVVGSVVVNGTPVIPVPSSYTFTNVTTNHTLAAGFASNFSPGIIANYYLGQTWSVPAATNVAGRIHFADTASGAASDVTNWPVGYIGRDDNFSVNFSGYIRIDTEADYTFYLTSDDGSWLNIDGNQVINNGGLHSPATVQQTVHLTPGYHRIFLPMFENTGGAVVWLEYSSPSVPRTFNVPLYHSPITPPTVDFTGSPLAGPAPHTVQFTDASVGATTWIWNFGDGTPVSYLQNPAHTYAAIGQYNVTLVAANTFGANTKTRLNYVLVGASFSPGLIGTYFANETWTDPGRSRTDVRIRFADSSSGEVSDDPNWPTSILGQTDYFSVNWDGYLRVTTADSYTFSLRSDDGSWLWLDESQIINNGGLHGPTTVTGTVSLLPGYHHLVVRMFEHTGGAVARLQYSSPNLTLQDVSDVWHISAVPPAPVAGFSGTPLSGTVPLTVTFTDSSTNNPTSWLWNFGDGDATNNTVRNPVHRYGTAGTYTVALTSTNAGGSNTQTRNNYIVVSPSPPVAGFSGSPLSGGVPLTVIFTDSSTNTPTSWLWNFGDGNPTNNTQQNPVHRYAVAGTYTVSLIATNTAGSNTSTRANYITANPQAPVAAFTGTPTSGIMPLTVTFTDSSTNTPSSWLWNFGDGDTTNNTFMNPVHRYASTGTYTVMLTVTNAGGSNSTTRTNYITVNPPPPVAGFIGTPISGNRPLTVTFTDSSTNNPTSWLWNFGDGDTTNNSVKNPVHRYSGAGTYTVLLTATNAGGSNSTTKTNYITVNLPPRQNILFDDFETIFSASWIQTGSLDWYTGSPKLGTHSIRIRGTESMRRTIPTTGYSDIIISFYLGAQSLEGAEAAIAEWSPDGSTWTTMAQIINGDTRENGQLYAYSYTAPVSAANNPNFVLRFRNTGSGATNDNAYVDNVLVTGIPN